MTPLVVKLTTMSKLNLKGLSLCYYDISVKLLKIHTDESITAAIYLADRVVEMESLHF